MTSSRVSRKLRHCFYSANASPKPGNEISFGINNVKVKYKNCGLVVFLIMHKSRHQSTNRLHIVRCNNIPDYQNKVTSYDRDVNKDLTPKDQDKDKDLTPKDQDKDLTHKDQDKDKDLL